MNKIHPRAAALVRQATTKNPVHRMGILRALIEGAQQEGRRVNPAWVSEAQRLALWAQMNLSPQQLHRANLLAEQAKHEWVDHVWNQRQAQEAEHAEATTEKNVRQMTHGMLGQSQGISKAQLFALRDGKNIPRERRPRFSQAAMDGHWRDLTRHLDPKGKGWGEEEGIRRLDALVDAKPDKFASEARQFRGDVASLRREAKQWEEQRIGYGLLMKRTRRDIQLGRQREDTHEPNARDRRRAAVVDAYLSTTADAIDKDTREGNENSEASHEFMDRVPNHLLEEEHDGKPTRRAQIARIVAEADADGEYEE